MKSNLASRASKSLLVSLSLFGWSASAAATVVWRADFEAGTISPEWNSSISATNGTRKNIEFVTDVVQRGSVAAKITIHPDDLFEPYSQSRVEVHHDSMRTGEGQDTYLSWHLRMNADPGIRDNIGYWESNVSFQNMMTFWVAPKQGGGSTVNFGTGALGATPRWMADLVIDTWHQIAMHVHWSTNATLGKVSVWYDGVQVLRDVTVKTKADANPLFFQTGLHRSDPAQFVDTIYIDNFIEADSLADVLGPAMDGGSVRNDASLADGSSAGTPETGGPVPDAGGGAGGASGTGGSGGGGGGGVGGSTMIDGGDSSSVSTSGAGGSGDAADDNRGGAAGSAQSGSAGTGARRSSPTAADGGCSCTLGRSTTDGAFAVVASLLVGAAMARLRFRPSEK